MSQRSAPFTGRKMLLAMLAFFGVIILANGIMMTFAISTHTGAVVQNSYVASQDFNHRIAEARTRDALGWRSAASVEPGLLALRFSDSAGRPLDDLAIDGVIGRPVTDADDRALAFLPAASGVYQAPVTLAPGEWRLTATAVAPDGARYARDYVLLVRKTGA